MSDVKNSKNNPEDFFQVEIDLLRIGSRVTFDSYVYLEKNDRFLLWLRATSTLETEKFNNLKTKGNLKIFIPNAQRAEFQAYLNVGKVMGTGETSPGKVNAEDVDASKGKVAQENSNNNFGAISLQSDKIFISGSKIGSGSQAQTLFGSISMSDDGMTVSSGLRANVGPKEQKPQSDGSAGPAAKLKIDVEFLNTFIRSTQVVFLETCKSTIQFKSPTRRNPAVKNAFKIDVASFIGLVSNSIRGSIGLCFPAPTFLYFLGQVTGQEVTKVTPELIAGSGELMNLIFEIARPALIEQGYPLERATPTLASGSDLPLGHLISDPGFSIVFESPGGPFQFEVGVKTGA